MAEKLRSVLALDYPRDLIEVLVVSDASTDRTESIVGTFVGDGVRFLRLPRGGKPAAINAAIPLTQGEILLLTDVRQILAPDSLQFLVWSKNLISLKTRDIVGLSCKAPCRRYEAISS